MIQSVDTFIKYFGGIRRRTLNFIRAIPDEQIDWSPKDGELTCGDYAPWTEPEGTIPVRGVSPTARG